jgi:hypothetical protein
MMLMFLGKVTLRTVLGLQGRKVESRKLATLFQTVNKCAIRRKYNVFSYQKDNG